MSIFTDKSPTIKRHDAFMRVHDWVDIIMDAIEDIEDNEIIKKLALFINWEIIKKRNMATYDDVNSFLDDAHKF